MSNNIEGRQYPLIAWAQLGPSNIGAGNEKVLKVRPGTLLRNLQVLTLTGFNVSTTTTITVSDGVTTFVNAQDVKTAGSETVAVGFKFFPNGGTITISLANTGTAPTAGDVHVLFDAVVMGRSNEVERFA